VKDVATYLISSEAHHVNLNSQTISLVWWGSPFMEKITTVIMYEYTIRSWFETIWSHI
jgi:hypothetical protein